MKETRAYWRGMKVVCAIDMGIVGVVTRVARDCSWVDVRWEHEGYRRSKRMKTYALRLW